MKKIIVLLCMLTILACKKNEAEKDEPGLMDAVEGINNLSKAGDALEDFEKKQEELKTMKPVSNEILKNVLTESLGDLKRTHFSAGDTSMMGLTSAEATYGDDSEKNIKLSVFDGAGETGSSILALTVMALSMNRESIDDTKTKKVEVINGVRCLTEDDTNPESLNSSITFLYNDRFQIGINGAKISLEELKSYLKKIDLSKLD
ncbi:hypothetical protein FIA58_012525 [Flavobacterium jejuense]|uniref:Uncharacterized protein n=1 Tax=Flavobacterium jejuense TaxID=1544455 RepID=A0ABX0IVE5_9FLAO|nr:hypothetical protein [Flavobacterium jejuense]NHN26503.1 hypothetical protein [Flavobacterium jejuense]